MSELHSALEFCELMLSEIAETCPNTHLGNAALLNKPTEAHAYAN